MSETEDTDTGVAQEQDRLMLHFGERGPVELEVWHEEAEEATHLVTEYPNKGAESIDITDRIRRAGYKLVEADA